MSLDHDRLKNSRRRSVRELCAAQGSAAVFTHEQPQVTVFVVAAVGEILALDDLLHDVVCIDASVVQTTELCLQRSLLPPGGPVERGGRGGWRPLGLGGRGLSVWLSGRGGLVQTTGGAAAAGRVPLAQVGQAGRSRVACAVA